MAQFEQAHKFTARWEGGISDHPADRGGYTAYGVSQEFLKDMFASACGRVFLTGLGFSPYFDLAEMKKKMTPLIAARIFCFEFWQGQDLSQWPSQELATVYYDMSVNHGRAGACRMLQQALNAVNGAGLKVDGKLGPLTRAAAHKGDRGTAMKLCELREAYFKKICQSRPSQAVFLKGWLNRVKDLRKHIS